MGGCPNAHAGDTVAHEWPSLAHSWAGAAPAGDVGLVPTGGGGGDWAGYVRVLCAPKLLCASGYMQRRAWGGLESVSGLGRGASSPAFEGGGWAGRAWAVWAVGLLCVPGFVCMRARASPHPHPEAIGGLGWGAGGRVVAITMEGVAGAGGWGEATQVTVCRAAGVER